jgi:hypothetical protein
MTNHFDLNIQNYNIRELEEIFELSGNFDKSHIELKEAKLRQNISNDLTISNTTKQNTLIFITEVKQRLLENANKNKVNGLENLKNVFKHVYNTEQSLTGTEIVSAGSTDIIRQPPTPYAQSFPSEFYAGQINPLNKRILKQNINIDTRFRENYYKTLSANFHVDLPLRLTNVVSLQLAAMELPITFFTISKIFQNNFFAIISGDEQLVITIPDGNYDYLALQNYINTFLSESGDPFNSIEFLVDINTPNGSTKGGSGRMIVGTKSSISFSLSFLTDRYGNEDRQTPLPLKLGWLMGFREGYYENSVSYVSEGIVNLLGPRYIYLVIDDFNNNVNDGFYAAFNSSILNKNILARISLQGSVFNYMSQNNISLITTPRQYFGPVDIQKLQIQLLDEYGRILDLNNMDYSFCLTFQTVYDL